MRNKLFLVQYTDEECTYLISAIDESIAKMKFVKYRQKQGWFDQMRKDSNKHLCPVFDLIRVNEIPIPKSNEVIQSGLAAHFYG